jgi:2-hydroxy-3-oxopropionate reductase
MHKDLSFVLESAAAAGAAVPMAAAGVELYAELKRQRLGDRDLAVVRQTIANLSDNPTVNTTVNPAVKTN